MDFSAKRMALLAGLGGPEDRHVVVQELVQELNESSAARQLNEAEEDVRKAVRRTIQKMVSEGAINLREDSIARELEHLRANLQADHDHIAALVDDMHDDKDEIERAEHNREEMHEGEGYGITGGAMHVFEEDDDDDDELEEEMVDGVEPAPPAYDQRVGELSEEDQEEGMIYEMEDGTVQMQIGEKRYLMKELEGGEDLDEVLDEVEIDTFTDKDGNKWSSSE